MRQRRTIHPHFPQAPCPPNFGHPGRDRWFLFSGGQVNLETTRAVLPKSPSGFHAFLLADLTIDDPGVGTYVDVVFLDGYRLRARASAEVLRMGSQLQERGLCRATLHFRTDHEGFLVEPLHLYRVRRELLPLDSATGTYWSATGLRQAHRNHLMVYPERAKATPFRVAFKIPDSLQLPNQIATALHLSGSVCSNQLVANSVSASSNLDIPARWANWRPST